MIYLLQAGPLGWSCLVPMARLCLLDQYILVIKKITVFILNVFPDPATSCHVLCQLLFSQERDPHLTPGVMKTHNCSMCLPTVLPLPCPCLAGTVQRWGGITSSRAALSPSQLSASKTVKALCHLLARQLELGKFQWRLVLRETELSVPAARHSSWAPPVTSAASSPRPAWTAAARRASLSAPARPAPRAPQPSTRSGRRVPLSSRY
jgi:hypothetical protein